MGGGTRRAPRAGGRPRQLHPEVLELAFGETAFEKRSSVNPRSGVTLEKDLVAWAPVRLSPKEMVEADLVQGSRRGKGRQVTTYAFGDVVRPYDHDGCVPSDVGPDPSFRFLVAGEPGLLAGRDRVDVRGRDGGGEADLAFLRPLEQFHEQKSCTRLAMDFEHRVERVDPLFGLGRVDIGELMGDAVEDHALHRRAKYGLSVVGRRSNM